jgi:uncharacterized protein YacL
MRTYVLPVDLHQEEKIIGGYLSARQSGYIVAGVVVASLFYFAIPFKPLAVVVAVIPVVIAGFLAFISVGGERADKYLILLLDRRPRKYYYHRYLMAVSTQKNPKNKKQTMQTAKN